MQTVNPQPDNRTDSANPGWFRRFVRRRNNDMKPETPANVMTATMPVGSGDWLGGWVDVKEKLPPFLTPVLMLDMNTHMAFDPYGRWKGVGVLAGEEMWRPYWSVISENGGRILDAVTHWMPIPANPPNEKS